MSSPTLGVVPKLLPVTGSYLVPFSIGHLILSLNIVRLRIATNSLHGDSLLDDSGKPQPRGQDPLYLAVRSQQNYLEYVPLTLLVASAIELNGGTRKKLASALAFFFVTRISHFIGLGYGVIPARIFGYYGTIGATLGLSGWLVHLCKGYWEF